jgi:hypothetical protein
VQGWEEGVEGMLDLVEVAGEVDGGGRSGGRRRELSPRRHVALGWWASPVPRIVGSFRKSFLLPLQVDCPYPPSDKVGIISVQRENEEIVPMKAMKMDWVPYVPLEDRYFHATFLYLSFGCIPTFIFSSSQYCIFVHFSLSCSIGSAGLRVWKPKYSLFVAPSEGQFC